MTIEEFISILKEKKYRYRIEGDKVVVTRKGDVKLGSLTSLPSVVEFNNSGNVDLLSLTSLPSGVVFKNEGNVLLNSLTSLTPGMGFRNRGSVHLDSLTSIPPGVVFRNRGGVYLHLLGGWFSFWKGNIKGIDSDRLLKVMIKQKVFER
jgi:hypothetical protein